MPLPSRATALLSCHVEPTLHKALVVAMVLACATAQAGAGSAYPPDTRPTKAQTSATKRRSAGRPAGQRVVPDKARAHPAKASVPLHEASEVTGTARQPSTSHGTGKTSAGTAVGDDEIEEISNEAITVQDKPGPSTWWGDSWPVWDRVFDAHTPRTSRKHTFNTLISHRNFGGFAQEPFHSLLGFDKGLLKVGLGVRFGILDRLDVGVIRFNGTVESFNTYEFDLKYQLLTQSQFGLDLGLRAGLSWFEQNQAKDAVGALAQLLIGRLLYDRVYVGGGFLFHSNSSGPKKSRTDVDSSTAFQLYVDGRIFAGLSFAFELTKNIAGYSLVNPVMTFGPRFITNRHTFAIVLSNSQYTDADGIVTGSDHTNFSSWMLGFNITREL